MCTSYLQEYRNTRSKVACNRFLIIKRNLLQRYHIYYSDTIHNRKGTNWIWWKVVTRQNQRHSITSNQLVVYIKYLLTLRWLMSYIYIEHPFLLFLDYTQRRSTVGRTPVDEWWARRRDLYLTTHDTHNRQISMPPVGFEPTISAGERPAATLAG